MLRGMVDVGKELAKLEEKIEKLDGLIAKMRKSMSVENYEEKVSQTSMTGLPLPCNRTTLIGTLCVI